LISSLLSSAAFLPTSGLDQAPSHLVVALPMLILTGAFEENKACASVLTATNSTHSSHASIILLIAFDQPHPTQITLIFATGEI